MSVPASARLCRQRLVVFALVAATSGTLIGAVAGAASAQEPEATGTWQSHRYQFQYLSNNTTYACGGLIDKLRLLLRTVDARDVQVTPVCLGNPGLPDRFAQADLRFQSLVPSAQGAPSGAGATAPGTWHHVQWTPRSPPTLGFGDCSLVEQLLKTVLPLLATRNLQTRFDCAQNHDYGAFSVSFDVFAPADAK